MINKTRFEFTEVTSIKKAYEIKRILKKENRFINLIHYKLIDGTYKYYLFYYNFK